MKHLERALDGQNQIWKYIVVILIALIGGQILGSIPLGVAIVIAAVSNGGDFVAPENTMDFAAYGINPSLGLMLLVIPFIATLFIAISMIKSFHKRNTNDVINGGRAFRWNRFWMGSVVWGVVILVVSMSDILINKEDYVFQFDALAFIPLVVVSLLFLPIQSGTEEYIFRGYLAQGVGAWSKNRLLVVLLPTVLFALMHAANPEVKEHGFLLMMPQYFLVGLSLALIAVLDDGIELAIGVHAINNCMGSILITSKESVLQTPALFVDKEIDPVGSLVAVTISSVLMIVIFKLIYKWDFSVLFKKIKPTEELIIQEN